MPIRGSPNGAYHLRPQAGRDRPEWVVAINRNRWSHSIGISGRNQPVRAVCSMRISQRGPRRMGAGRLSGSLPIARNAACIATI